MSIRNPAVLFTLLMALQMILPGLSEARTKLAAIPARDDAVIRLDNPRSTLIQEKRTLTLQKGLNQVDFSWKGVRISEDSIKLDILSPQGSVTLLSVSYPPQEPALVWAIHSDQPAQVEVRISYLLSRIDSLSTYKTVVSRDEAELDLNVYQVVRNFSGEDFGPAMAFFETSSMNMAELRHEETKQLLDLSSAATPVEKRVTFDSQRHPWDPEKEQGTVGLPVTYSFANVSRNGLGRTTLPEGKMRMFIRDGHQGVVFLGEDRVGPVQVGQNMEATVGQSRDVKVTQRKMTSKRVNVRRNNDNHVVLHDQEEVIKAEVRSFKEDPVQVRLLEHIPGEWEMLETNLEYVKEDANTLRYEVQLPAKGSKELRMHYRRTNIR
jgi:hypothetical protein